jgi:hypothetical protein
MILRKCKQVNEQNTEEQKERFRQEGENRQISNGNRMSRKRDPWNYKGELVL